MNRAQQVRAEGGVLDAGSIGSFGFVRTPKRLIIAHASWLRSLQPCDVRRIRELHRDGLQITELARRYNTRRKEIAELVYDQPSARTLGARDETRIKAGKPSHQGRFSKRR